MRWIKCYVKPTFLSHFFYKWININTHKTQLLRSKGHECLKEGISWLPHVYQMKTMKAVLNSSEVRGKSIFVFPRIALQVTFIILNCLLDEGVEGQVEVEGCGARREGHSDHWGGPQVRTGVKFIFLTCGFWSISLWEARWIRILKLKKVNSDPSWSNIK